MVDIDKIQRVLGFDFGLRRIGVAVGQRLTCTASPVTTLLAQNGVPNWYEFKKLVAEWLPNAILVGLPLNMDGSMSEMANRAEAFAKEIEAHCSIPVFRVDERLSTFEAKNEFMRVRGVQGLRKGQKVDAFAAVVLVESWLNAH